MIQALIPLISAALSGITNIALSERQKKYDESMIDNQNEYNLPVNQIQRLKDAGINPSTLGMGQGITVQGNTSAQPNGYQLPNVVDPMSLASNSMLAMMQAQESKEKALSEKTFRQARLDEIQQQTEKYKQEIVMLGLDQKAQEIANDYAGIMNEVAIGKSLSEINLNDKEAENFVVQTKTAMETLEKVLPKQIQLMIDRHELNVLDQQKVVAEIQRLYSEANLMDKESVYYQEMATSEWYKQSNYAADTQKKGAESDYLRHQIQQFLDTYDDVVTQTANDTKLSNRQVASFWINTILHGSAQVGQHSAGTAMLIKSLATLFK